MKRVVLLCFLTVSGCLLGVEPRDAGIGFEDGEVCEESFQCLRGLTCSFSETVCRPVCLNTSDCEEGRLCILTIEDSADSVLGSFHYDGCIPEELYPPEVDEDDWVRVSYADESEPLDTGE